MGKYLLILAVLQLGLSSVAVAAAKDPVPVVFGGLQIFPVLEVDETYNSNLFQVDTTAKQTSSLITTISPSLEVGIESDGTAVSVHYQFDKGSHSKASTADYTDHTLGAKAESSLTKRLALAGSFTYKKGHELRGASQLAGVQIALPTDKLVNTNIAGQVSYGIRGRIDLSGALDKKRYDDLVRGKVADVDTMTGTIALSFPIRTKGRAVLEARYTNNNFIDNLNTLDNSEQAYFIGVDWDNKSKTTGSVRIGYLSTSYDNFPGGSIFSWEIDAGWMPRSDSKLNFNSSYKPINSQSEYGYAVSNANQISWEHEWSEVLRHTTSIGYDLIDYNSAAVAGFTNYKHKEQLASVSVAVDYRLRRWLMIGGGYDFTNRTSDLAAGAVANPTYRQHLFSLNFKGTM